VLVVLVWIILRLGRSLGGFGWGAVETSSFEVLQHVVEVLVVELGWLGPLVLRDVAELLEQLLLGRGRIDLQTAQKGVDFGVAQVVAVLGLGRFECRGALELRNLCRRGASAEEADDLQNSYPHPALAGGPGDAASQRQARP
jgi:hypothetical protein